MTEYTFSLEFYTYIIRLDLGLISIIVIKWFRNLGIQIQFLSNNLWWKLVFKCGYPTSKGSLGPPSSSLSVVVCEASFGGTTTFYAIATIFTTRCQICVTAGITLLCKVYFFLFNSICTPPLLFCSPVNPLPTIGCCLHLQPGDQWGGRCGHNWWIASRHDLPGDQYQQRKHKLWETGNTAGQGAGGKNRPGVKF